MEIDAEVIGQHELHHAHRIGRAGKAAQAHLLWPVSPRRAAVPILQGHEQRVVVEPALLALAERRERLAKLRARAPPEAIVGPSEHLPPPRRHPLEIDMILRELGHILPVGGLEQPVAAEPRE